LKWLATLTKSRIKCTFVDGSGKLIKKRCKCIEGKGKIKVEISAIKLKKQVIY